MHNEKSIQLIRDYGADTLISKLDEFVTANGELSPFSMRDHNSKKFELRVKPLRLLQAQCQRKTVSKNRATIFNVTNLSSQSQ